MNAETVLIITAIVNFVIAVTNLATACVNAKNANRKND